MTQHKLQTNKTMSYRCNCYVKYVIDIMLFDSQTMLKEENYTVVYELFAIQLLTNPLLVECIVRKFNESDIYFS